MPPALHILKRITFCVRVPVLSLKTYWIMPRSVTLLLRALAGVSVVSSYMSMSSFTKLSWMNVTISSVTYMLRGMKLLKRTRYVSQPLITVDSSVCQSIDG